MENENYIVIQGWMINELKLKANELIIYAIIYGFSQDNENEYNGGLSYLAECTNSTKQGVIKCLKSLLEKEYITKEEVKINGIKYCKYKANCKKFNGIKQSLPGVLNKVEWGIKQSLPNNKEDINSYVSICLNGEKNKTDKKSNKNKFIKPTIEEIKKYCKERKNNIDAETFYDFYESKGWVVGKSAMKDWKAAIRTWERSKNNTSSKPQKETKSIYQTYEEYMETKDEREEYYRKLGEAQHKANEEGLREVMEQYGINNTKDKLIEGLEDW